METETTIFNNKEAIALGDLVDIEKLKELLERFYRLTGYGVAITDKNNKVLVSLGREEICSDYHRKNPGSYKNCLESDQYILKHLHQDKFISYKCKNGLWDVAFPINVSGNHLATLFFGQFFYSEKEKNIADFTRRAEKFNYKTDAYIKALKNAKVISKNELSRIVSFFDSLAYNILEIAFSKYIFIKQTVEEKSEIAQKLKESLDINQTLTHTIPIAIVLLNKDGEIKFANNQAEKRLGIKKDDITGRSYNAPEWKITDFDGNPFPNEQLPFVRVQNERETISDLQHAIEWPDGERIYLSINASPLFDDEGNFNGMVASMEDITEKVKAEREVKENNDFIKAIIDNAADGLCVCHNCAEFPYVKFTIWNEQMKEITGYTIDEINRKGWYQTLYPDPKIQKKAIERMNQMREGTNIITEEWEIETKNKGKRAISISTSIVNAKDGQTNVMALMNDITDKKEAEKALKIANKKLKESNASKDKFLSILAHDLKNPFGAIVGVSDLICEAVTTKDHDALSSYASILNKSVKNSYDLLTNLLEWSRTQSDNMEFNPEWLGIDELIQEAIDLHENFAKTKGVQVINLAKKKQNIYADRFMITAVLRNLISNGLKYSYSGGEISINAVRVENEFVISVADKGIGIEKKVLSRLFKIEENNSTLGTANEKGTGLGLLLSKEFVDYHHGRIWAESEPGKGSVFSFSLPITQKVSSDEKQESLSKENKTILIGEDEEINFLLLKAMLRSMKCKIIHAYNGAEVLDSFVKNENITLVLMDIKMPVMDGVTATKKIRQIKPDIPVIAQTAYDLSKEHHKLFQGYISKPIDKADLVKLVNKYIL